MARYRAFLYNESDYLDLITKTSQIAKQQKLERYYKSYGLGELVKENKTKENGSSTSSNYSSCSFSVLPLKGAQSYLTDKLKRLLKK